jgi:predicted dinucleotide-binding enzyme
LKESKPEAGSMCTVLTVPYEFHKPFEKLKPSLQGRCLMSLFLLFPKVSTVQIPPHGSAAMQAQIILGEGVKVISAFQNISFELLLSDKKIECDVLVCGTDLETRELGLRLLNDAVLVCWDECPLENSIVQEGLTSVLIRINKNSACILQDANYRRSETIVIMSQLIFTQLLNIPLIEEGG